MEREQLTKFKNIADKILEELGYGNSKEIILDRKEASVWGYINQNTENSLYYIVSTCKEQDFYNIDFEELQAEIFKGIKGLFAQETGIEKNTTWLIGVECEKDYENLMEKILAIEENPYYFKKMVCPYLQIEINEFLKEIGSCQNYILYMQKQIVKVNRFVDFHEKNDMGYNFISKLLIKIPSIKLPTEKEKKASTLSEDIEDEIKNEKLQKIYEFLLQGDINEKINMVDDKIDDLHELYYGKAADDE